MYDFFAVFSIGCDHWIFDHELVEVSLFVNLLNEFALGFFATLVDQEGHDGFGDDVSNVLFYQVEVRLDEVLDDTGFHDYAAGFLMGVGTHLVWDLGQDNWRKVRPIEDELLRLLDLGNLSFN